jgi:hypothetical protein
MRNAPVGSNEACKRLVAIPRLTGWTWQARVKGTGAIAGTGDWPAAQAATRSCGETGGGWLQAIDFYIFSERKPQQAPAKVVALRLADCAVLARANMIFIRQSAFATNILPSRSALVKFQSVDRRATASLERCNATAARASRASAPLWHSP